MQIDKTLFKTLQKPVFYFLLLSFLLGCGEKIERKEEEKEEKNIKKKNETKEPVKVMEEDLNKLDSLLEENIAKNVGLLQEKLNTWKDMLQYLKDEFNSPEFQQKNPKEQEKMLEQIKSKKDSIENLIKEAFP